MNHQYLIALTRIPLLGPARLKRLLDHYADLSQAWTAPAPELLALGFSEQETAEIIEKRQQINPAEEMERLEKSGISFVVLGQADYPALLAQIYNPPPVLYYRGSLAGLQAPCLGVVGARKHTAYGQQVVSKIIGDLVSAGMTIVSGLALGIDALAHQATLDNHGLTAAVLGSDLSWDNIGPKTNYRLAEKILDSGGCLLSEFALGISANRSTFPQRNRLISGLSRGVLVVEASGNSGSLITANYALEQGRDVFAVPGNIFSDYSMGTNNLIKKGAKLIMSAADIIEEFDWLALPQITQAKNENPLTEMEALVLDQLSTEPLHLDKIVQVCNIKINVLSSLLMMLTIKGLAKDIGGGNYIKLI